MRNHIYTGRKIKWHSILIATGLALTINMTALAADSTDSSMPQPHSDSVGAAISDTAITTKVKTKFLGDDRLKGSNITVTTTNGVVTLTGTASETSKSAAESLAQGIEGVKSVDNSINTPSTGPVSSTAKHVAKKTKRVVSDSWITTKVKSEILSDSVSKGFDVSVKTVHGVVILSGTLANQDAIDHVKDMAEKVKGVKSVDITDLKAPGT
jgi:hyperosmotically inducible periplasmic protein